MRFLDIKGKLLLAVSALVISSVMLVSMLVTQRYGRSLMEAMEAQAENLSHGMALEAADKVLLNDLVILQKMLDHQMRGHPAISYAFVFRGDQILAHTFNKGVPVDLVHANKISAEDQSRLQKIVSQDGERFLDIAYPIFDGKAGTLRLGLSERPYEEQMKRLWYQVGVITLVILLLAISGTLIFVRRITRPLSILSEATHRVENGDLAVRVEIEGKDEIGRLGASFNHMIGRIDEYTSRVKEQTNELKRAYDLARTSCGVVQEIGALRSLAEMGAFLIRRFRDIMKCQEMLFLFPGEKKDVLFEVSPTGVEIRGDEKTVHPVLDVMKDLRKVTFLGPSALDLEFPCLQARDVAQKALVPIPYENLLLGALVTCCPRGCQCNANDVEILSHILSQAAGVIKRALVQEEELLDFQKGLEVSAEFSGMIGRNPKIQTIFKLIDDIAPTDATVLIQGESGTGKELVARAIHQRSPRRDKPFIVVNCAAYPATLIESELFGHEKGAFTGAIRQKIGRFEQAHGGTVFLDEIAEISSSAQIILLRVIQTQKFERVGGEKTVSVDVRIMAATNKDLIQEVKNGRFREDLYYRLNVIPIQLPPIRERRNDIPLLARHFLSRFSKEQRKEIMDFTPDAMRIILDYSWPGNVRELENSIEHATVLSKGGMIEAFDLPVSIREGAVAGLKEQGASMHTMRDHEREFLRMVLEECGWNKKKAARRLGISRNTLYLKLKKYNLVAPIAH